MNYTQKLFEIIDIIGERSTGEFHIIDTTDSYPADSEKSYKVYHEGGYCFDISKEVETEDKNGSVEYNYIFYSEWDGFKKLPPKELIKLFEK